MVKDIKNRRKNMKFTEKCLQRIKSICEKTPFTAKCYAFCDSHSELIRYAFFGVATTLFNMLIYLLASRALFNFIFKESFTLSLHNIFTGENIVKDYPPTALIALASNALAWVLAVAFSFFVNQVWVFYDKTRGLRLLWKLLQFYLLRTFSGLLEIIVPSLLIMAFSANDLAVKISVSVFVVLLNYFFTKFITFRKSKKVN